MAVKIRLSRKGRKKAPFYHIVVADARSPRDGKFIEKIGTYNPMTKPATIEIDRTAAYDWLTKGAQPTDTVRAILRFKGVYYKKHLMRGVKKGAITTEQMEQMLEKWIDTKEGRIAARRAQTAAEAEAFRLAVSGQPGQRKKAPVADAESAEAAEAFKVDSDEAASVDAPETTEVTEVVEDIIENATEEVTEPVAESIQEAQQEIAEPVAESIEEAQQEIADPVAESVEEAQQEVSDNAEEAEDAPQADAPTEE
jgi:small subunit ribosomal protein S16